MFASGDAVQCHTVPVTASIHVTPQVMSLTLNLQQSHNALGPWGSIYPPTHAPAFTEDFLRSKPSPATISVGLQHSYEIRTFTGILVLIQTSCSTLEALERLSSFWYMSAPGSEPTLDLRNPSFVPLDHTTRKAGLPLMPLVIYLKHAVHSYLVRANSHLPTKYIPSEKVS